MIYVLVVIVAILTAMAIWSKNALMGMVGAGFWLAIWIYFTNNYTLLAPTQSDPLVTTVLIGCVGAALATLMIPILQDNESDGGIAKRIKRIVNHGDFSDNSSKPHRETEEEYRAKVYHALHPNGAYRRRR